MAFSVSALQVLEQVQAEIGSLLGGDRAEAQAVLVRRQFTKIRAARQAPDQTLSISYKIRASTHVASRYARHAPERTLLYALVEAYYPDFIARIKAQDRSLPAYVREEFAAMGVELPLPLALPVRQ